MPEDKTAPPHLSFVGKVILAGVLQARTGLHIGSGEAGINPRGIDAPLISDPLSRRPYIPGSSLRGKLRALLVRKLGKTVQDVAQAGGKTIRLHSCRDETCEVCRLFGSVPPRENQPGQEQWSLPATLHLTDLKLLWNREGFEKEVKSENALDRITAQANPRQIERIPQGAAFSFSATYYVRHRAHLEEDLRNFLTTLALLQDDTLGGHGSRGYGAVSLLLTKVTVQRFGSHASAGQTKEWDLELPLEGARKQIVRFLPDLKAFLDTHPSITFPHREASASQTEELLRVACLHFSSPLHVGEPRVGLEGCVEEMVSSDTLFGALANAWVTLYGRQSLKELLGELSSASENADYPVPFLLSSAFPYVGEKFFLPKPLSRPPVKYVETSELKELKDADFLPDHLFSQWRKGSLDRDFSEKLKEGEKAELSRKNILPRLRLDRIDMASNLYFCGQVHFPDDGGLYLLVKGTEERLTQLQEALQFLGELGLGGERALGFGRFTLRGERFKALNEVDELRFLTSEVVNVGFLTLSLYHPSRSEMRALGTILGEENKPGGYRLVERGGWVDSPELRTPLRKKTCRLFVEGSVLFSPDPDLQPQRPPRGCLVDVTPDPPPHAPHKVYRYGFAFPVGMDLK